MIDGCSGDPLHPGRHGAVGAGDEDVFRALQHLPDDLLDLLRRFPGGIHRLRHPLPQLPVVIDLGEVQVFKRQMLQPLDGILRLQFPFLDSLKQSLDLLRGQ